MAGNPFRRSMAMAQPVEAPLTVSSTADVPMTPQKRTKKSKRVKIVSPHSTPDSTGHGGERRLSASDSATRAVSPPPPRGSDDSDDDEGAGSDSTTTADSDLDQAAFNKRRNSGSLPPPPTTSMPAGMKAPFNPFARTLATSEASFGLEQDAAAERPRQRPAMDVDAFKNILLTGSATPHTSTPSPADRTSSTDVRRPHDSSSSTDTSSIFDPTYSLQPESPRVDHYDFHSDSDDDDDHDDDHDIDNESESSNLMGQQRLDDLPPPAPPKNKPARGPQTVSFADFDQSIPPNFQAPGGRGTPPLNNAQQRGILRPTIHRSASDLNKPLPPPPGSREHSDLALPPTVPDKDVPPVQPPTSTSTPDDDTSTSKKVPPPPPASRRQAAAATPTRPRSASNLSVQESISELPSPETSSTTPPQVKSEDRTSHRLSLPPPPPPARKVHPVAPSSAASDSPLHAPTEAKPVVPPPPPRRHPSKPGSIRTASPANSLRKDVSSPPPVGNSAAPPPPPPRRAAGGATSSERSSIDGRPSSLRRFSGMENQRRASKQSVESAGSGTAVEQAALSPSSEAAKRDVLADMAAFQLEIDKLRIQAEGGR